MGYSYSVWGVLHEKKLVVGALDGGKAGEFDLSAIAYYTELQKIEKSDNWQVVIVGEDDHEHRINDVPEHFRIVMLCNCSHYFEDEYYKDYKENYKEHEEMYKTLIADGWEWRRGRF